METANTVDAMKDTCILVFDKNGVVSMRKRSTELKAGEYAVRVKISVPDHYFERAIPTAEISIPEDYIIEPVVGLELLPKPEPVCARCSSPDHHVSDCPE
ncbi:MAG: hypothetical protein M0R28_21055 [Pigmentiphaga sp.]|nr:hypothetical protein [Pigmentiphaga sp.]